MADQQFCLRWNNHQSTLISVFDSLLENGTLVDCTLAAEGQYLKAHKVVLSACSPYLETLLSQHYEKHPIVILKDVKFTELKSMMDYMYRGEVNISQDQLGTFLKAAESLQIKGLSDNGADGDGRDVGSTSKGPPPRKSQPATPNRPAEPQRPDVPLSPVHRSRDGSISPSSRKRRRIRRNSQGDDANMGDSHLDSNSCDLPIQAQSTPIVPNIPAAVTSITTTPIKATIVKPEQTDIVNRLDSNLNSLPPPESGLLKEKIEPISEPLLEPKTEYLDDTNNDDSVEDLTLDDDDEMDEMDMSNMSNMSNMSRPGPSHGNDVSQMANQGFVPWQIGGNQSGTDEVFMAAQEAVQAHRGDSQGAPVFTFASCCQSTDLEDNNKCEYDFFSEDISNPEHLTSTSDCEESTCKSIEKSDSNVERQKLSNQRKTLINSNTDQQTNLKKCKRGRPRKITSQLLNPPSTELNSKSRNNITTNSKLIANPSSVEYKGKRKVGRPRKITTNLKGQIIEEKSALHIIEEQKREAYNKARDNASKRLLQLLLKK